MELMIFDKNLNFKGILESQFSYRKIRRYSECGEFEINVNFDIEIMEMLTKGNIVYKKGDIEAGIIKYRNIKLDVEGKEVLVVSGKFITGLLDRRIIWQTENLDTTSELAIRQLISNNAIIPPDRKIPLLKLGSINEFTETIDYQVTYTNLLEEVEKIAIESKIGIRTRIDINTKEFIFETYKGKDKTSTVIFSQEAENVLEQEYIDSIDNYKNVALVAGEGEGQDREKITVGNYIGLDRFETFIDAKDIKREVDEVTMPIAKYRNKLKARGEVKLSEMTKIKTFDSEIDLNADLKYKIDYDLGDMVKCINKRWGTTINTRIIEIEEIFEENGMKINVVFGNKVPTIIDKIKAVM